MKDRPSNDGNTENPPTNHWVTILLVGTYLLVVYAASLYCLVHLWPKQGTSNNGAMPDRWQVDAEVSYLLIILLMGSLGSFVETGSSFIRYVGNNALVSRWAWWYMLRPVISSALSVIVYLIIRGGILTTNVEVEKLNIYGLAGLAGLVGMFSREAVEKLETLFKQVFSLTKSEKSKMSDGLPKAEDG